jgi:hypothetical protein
MPSSIDANFLESAIKLFLYYKKLGEGAIDQLDDHEIALRPNDSSNSIALIVHHLSGNMLSRWTDFLTTDGEKSWRNREAEFDQAFADKKSMMEAWEMGWTCLLNALKSLKPEDLSTIVYIRNEGQPVMEAIQRQLAHYPHHVGQILYQAKAIKGDAFRSLSIPKGGSSSYNQTKFSEEKSVRHFTDKV